MKRKMNDSTAQVNEKLHYKMFKKGKRWLFAGITTITFISLAGTVETVQVHAAENDIVAVDPGSSAAPSPIAGQNVQADDVAATSAGTSGGSSAVASSATSAGTASASSSVSGASSAAGNTTPVADSQPTTLAPVGRAKTAPVAPASSAATTATVSAADNASLSSFASAAATSSAAATPATPTSVTVETPDQVVNKDSHAADAKASNAYAEASDWTSFAKAYNDNQISYIKLVNDIVRGTDTTNLNNRTAGLTVDGDGHALDMGQASLNLGEPADPTTDVTTDAAGYPEFTITDVNGLKQTAPAVLSGDGTHAVIETAAKDYGKWVINVDNVLMTDDDPSSSIVSHHAERFVDAEDSLINFSGNNKFYLTAEVAQAGAVHIANGTTLDLERTGGTAGFSMFYFMDITADGQSDSGISHDFVAGDNVSIIANEYSGYNGNNYPVIYYKYASIKMGDNVTWDQDGFHNLIDTVRGTEDDATVEFGQNLNMTATNIRSTALNVAADSKVVFNAGTTLDIEQQYNAAVFDVASGSSVEFISPKSLHAARLTATGTVVAGSLFDVDGTLTVHDSEVDLWDGTTSSADAAAQTEQFTSMTVAKNTATLVDAGGASHTVDVSGIRELKTTGVGVGTVTVNYVDSQNKMIATQNLPLDSSNYIGQLLPLATDAFVNQDMPANYHWALTADQMAAGAQADAQSKGNASSTNDNGDALGQANFAIVPIAGTTYTYNIYVYGDPEQVTYTYVDVATGAQLAPNASGSASAVTANFGNVIDWTDAQYISAGVPAGYHYAQGAELNGKTQPTTMTVGTANPLTTLYVAGDQQTVTIAHEDEKGVALTATSKATLTGAAGQKVTIPAPDSVAGYTATGLIKFNGQVVKVGDEMTLQAAGNTLTFVYRTVDYDAQASASGSLTDSAAVSAKNHASAADSYAAEAGSYAANASASDDTAASNAKSVAAIASANTSNADIASAASAVVSAATIAASAKDAAAVAASDASVAAVAASSAATVADSAAAAANSAAGVVVSNLSQAASAASVGDQTAADSCTAATSDAATLASQAAAAASTANDQADAATKTAQQKDILASAAAATASSAAAETDAELAQATRLAGSAQVSSTASAGTDVAASVASEAKSYATDAGKYASQAGSYAGDADASRTVASQNADAIAAAEQANPSNAEIGSLASDVASASGKASSAAQDASVAASQASDAAKTASSAATAAESATSAASHASADVVAALSNAASAVSAGDQTLADSYAADASTASTLVQSAASAASVADEQASAATKIAEDQDSVASSAAKVASEAADLTTADLAKANILAGNAQTGDVASAGNDAASTAATSAKSHATQAGSYASEAGSYATQASASGDVAAKNAASAGAVATANAGNADISRVASAAGSSASVADTAAHGASTAASAASDAAGVASSAATVAESAASAASHESVAAEQALSAATSAVNAGNQSLAGSNTAAASIAASLASSLASVASAADDSAAAATSTAEQQDSVASSAAKVASDAADLTAVNLVQANSLAKNAQTSSAAGADSGRATSAAADAHDYVTAAGSYASEAGSYAVNAGASSTTASENADAIAAVATANSGDAEITSLASAAGSASSAASSAAKDASTAASGASDAASQASSAATAAQSAADVANGAQSDVSAALSAATSAASAGNQSLADSFAADATADAALASSAASVATEKETQASNATETAKQQDNAASVAAQLASDAAKLTDADLTKANSLAGGLQTSSAASAGHDAATSAACARD